MKRKILAIATTGLFAAAALGGCANAASDSVAEPVTLENIVGTWNFVSGDAGNGEFKPVDAHPADLVVEAEGAFHGTTGCNNMFGTLTADAGAVDMGAVGTTMMACEENQMVVEADYLAALNAVTEGQLVGDELVLKGEGTELRFNRG